MVSAYESLGKALTLALDDAPVPAISCNEDLCQSAYSREGVKVTGCWLQTDCTKERHSRLLSAQIQASGWGAYLQEQATQRNVLIIIISNEQPQDGTESDQPGVDGLLTPNTEQLYTGTH